VWIYISIYIYTYIYIYLYLSNMSIYICMFLLYLYLYPAGSTCAGMCVAETSLHLATVFLIYLYISIVSSISIYTQHSHLRWHVRGRDVSPPCDGVYLSISNMSIYIYSFLHIYLYPAFAPALACAWLTFRHLATVSIYLYLICQYTSIVYL